ncbi:MAG: hypothetical protein R3A47_10395 [Polyangiales bacterium]
MNLAKSQEAGATNIHIKADVPLSEMFGYIGDLRSIYLGPWPVLDGVQPLRRPDAEQSLRRSKKKSALAKKQRNNRPA